LSLTSHGEHKILKYKHRVVTSARPGRLLDTPEFLPLHDHGNAEAVFDRLDWQPNHTLLRESFNIAVTDPAYNAVGLDSGGDAVTASQPLSGSQCAASGYQPNPAFIQNLLPYDLTRGGHLYAFHATTDVKEVAVYAQDSINLGRLTLNPGVRYDSYNGLSQRHQPRLATAKPAEPTPPWFSRNGSEYPQSVRSSDLPEHSVHSPPAE
jgi:outer membrane receptor protein involved in Fe transport